MKRSLKTAFFLIALGLMVVSTIPVKAQCAQCAATVATNTANGGSLAKGLNSGIIFLMFAPYMVVGIGGFIWYKKYRRKNVAIDMGSEKLNLN
jgi:hypothetical protein